MNLGSCVPVSLFGLDSNDYYKDGVWNGLWTPKGRSHAGESEQCKAFGPEWNLLPDPQKRQIPDSW
jgi:hypothetical protein